MKTAFQNINVLLENTLKDQWPFEIEHCTGLYANGSPEGALSNSGSAIAELILRVKTLNSEKNEFLPKISGQLRTYKKQGTILIHYI